MKQKRLFLILCILAVLALSPWYALADTPQNGYYTIGVDSSSSMFKIDDCALLVQDGQLTVTLVLSGTGYGYVYQGTPEEAAAAPQDSWIPYAEVDGKYTYTFAIPSLDSPVDVAAYSTKKEKWYDRQLVFHADSLRARELPKTKTLAPIPADGVYSIAVSSDSPLFSVAECTLTVTDGRMTAVLTTADARYTRVVPGTVAQTQTAAEDDMIHAVLDDQGRNTYTMPVDALDTDITLSTWSDDQSKWYERTIRFEGASFIPSSAYSFAFNGGSGRTTITCDGILETDDGLWATIVFSSSSYTYVQIDGTQYPNENTGGNSTFTIPVTENGATAIEAETVAMSQPRLITYTLYLYTDGTDAAQFTDTEAKTPETSTDVSGFSPPAIEGLTYVSTLPLMYAQNFAIHEYSDGYKLVQTLNGRSYLMIPEGHAIPETLEENCFALQSPLENAYLAATSAMSLIDTIGALEAIGLSGTRASGWYVENAKAAMEAGTILYAGKYSAPDYELILSHACPLAIESTMISHAPDVLEKLEELGIVVFIDLSNSESEPLGCTEWMLAYGALFGRLEAAQEAFAKQVTQVSALSTTQADTPTVAYFYVNSNGAVVTRSSSDNVPKLIALAGGQYVLPDGLNPSASSVTVTMEAYYAAAMNADVLIYNASINDAPASREALVEANVLFADFAAVQNNHVWCTGKSLYQSSNVLGDIAYELSEILSDPATDADFTYFSKMP